MNSLPNDPAPNEWQLRPEVLQGTETADARRLTQLESDKPKFPALPPQESWVYGQSSLAQRKRAEKELKLAAEQAGSRLPPTPAASGIATLAAAQQRRVQFGENEPRDMEDAKDALYDQDEEMKSDDESIAATTVTDKSMEEKPTETAPTPASSVAPGAARPQRQSFTPDPLYGEELDAQDEAWVASSSARGSTDASRARGGMRTDAFLACPACFTPLCVDCQRHATRRTMFRAMFVLENVLVDRARLVRPIAGTDDDHPHAKYYAVLCRVCKSHVGVLDEEEVYHFFNVIESQA